MRRLTEQCLNRKVIADKNRVGRKGRNRVEMAANENKGLADFAKKISIMITLLTKRWSVERDKSVLIRAQQSSSFTQPTCHG